MATARRKTAPRRAVPRTQTTAARAAAAEAARIAAEEEKQREQELADRSAARQSADNLPPAADDPDAEHNGDAPEPFVELTDASTGLPLLLDAMSVAHIGPGIGSVIHSDPSLAAKGEHEMGPVTEVSTLGGVLLKVLEDVETVAAVIGR